MSGCDWRYVFAAVGQGLCCFLQPENHAQSAESGAEQRVDAVALPAVSLPAFKPIEPSKYKRPCAEPQDQDACDLEAQWKAADAAENAAIWSWWQMIFSAFGLVGLLASLRLTQKALHVTRTTAQHQLRAHVLFINCEKVFDEREASRGFEVYFQNVGPTPAKHVIISGEMFIGDDESCFGVIPRGETFSEGPFVMAPQQAVSKFVSIPGIFVFSVLGDLSDRKGRSIILSGKFEYRDVYNSIQVTYYRLRLVRRGDGTTDFITCGKGNDAT